MHRTQKFVYIFIYLFFIYIFFSVGLVCVINGLTPENSHKENVFLMSKTCQFQFKVGLSEAKTGLLLMKKSPF